MKATKILYYTQGTSDKAYIITVEKVGDVYEVKRRWGRRNAVSKGAGQSRMIEFMNLRSALREANIYLMSKLEKGYTTCPNGKNPGAVSRFTSADLKMPNQVNNLDPVVSVPKTTPPKPKFKPADQMAQEIKDMWGGDPLDIDLFSHECADFIKEQMAKPKRALREKPRRRISIKK